MKTRVQIFLTSCLAICAAEVSAYGENMFQEGASWKVELKGVDSSSTAVYYIDGIEEIDDVECLRLRMRYEDEGESAEQLQTYLRCEGDKVWFMDNTDRKSWTLMYDFGLATGEECEVGIISYPFGATTEPSMYRVRCTDIVADSTYPEVQRMFVEVTNNEETTVSDTGVWLKGIGSESGILTNVYFNMSGLTTRLLTEAEVGGKRIYSSSGTGVSRIEREENTPDPRIFDLQGRELAEPVPGQLYIRGGKVLVEAK